MATGISYVDETLNPVVGCEPVSEGCARCYAATFAARELCETHKGLTESGAWTGRVRLVPEALERALRWTKPRRVLLPSMGDIFHDDVPDEYLAAIFGVMAASPKHTWLVLTKRTKRLTAWLDWMDDWALVRGGRHDDTLALAASQEVGARAGTAVATGFRQWPPRSVLLGATVENQRCASERLPELARLADRGWRTWVSIEPLLGPVDLVCALLPPGMYAGEDMLDMADATARRALARVEFAAIGGESGADARPCNVSWLRSVVRQCEHACMRVHLKQVGSHYIEPCNAVGGWLAKPPPEYGPLKRRLRHRFGGNPEEWPPDLRVRDLP